MGEAEAFSTRDFPIIAAMFRRGIWNSNISLKAQGIIVDTWVNFFKSHHHSWCLLPLERVRAHVTLSAVNVVNANQGSSMTFSQYTQMNCRVHLCRKGPVKGALSPRPSRHTAILSFKLTFGSLIAKTSRNRFHYQSLAALSFR